jgi:hypothetical protein
MQECTLEDLRDFDTWKAWKNGEIELTIYETVDVGEDNLTIFTNQYDRLKGQFVLSNDKVYRFIGLAEDEMDYYYVLYDGRKIHFHTCVGKITPLKGYIPQKDYIELIRLAKINHFDQPNLWGNKKPEEFGEFNNKHKHELLEDFDEHTKFIFGPCWELN